MAPAYFFNGFIDGLDEQAGMEKDMNWNKTAMAATVVLVLLCCSQLGCGKPTNKTEAQEGEVPEKTIEAVLKAHTEKLMVLPGVVGTGQGLCNGKPCIKIYISLKSAELEQKLPKTLDGYVVEVVETGEFRAGPQKK